MNKEDITNYRNLIESQLKDKETEIEISITYMTLALLGLFLTINEKFIPIISSTYKWSLFLSIFCFLISFTVGLVNKFMTTVYDRKIINFIDDNNLEDKKDEEVLLKNWEKYDSVLKRNKVIIYITLFLGLVFQLIYFFLNLNHSPEENKKNNEINIVKIKNDTIVKTNNNEIFIIKLNKAKK